MTIDASILALLSSLLIAIPGIISFYNAYRKQKMDELDVARKGALELIETYKGLVNEVQDDLDKEQVKRRECRDRLDDEIILRKAAEYQLLDCKEEAVRLKGILKAAEDEVIRLQGILKKAENEKKSK